MGDPCIISMAEHIMTGVGSVHIPHIGSVEHLTVTDKCTEVSARKDAQSTQEGTVQGDGNRDCQTSLTCCLHGGVRSIQKLVIATKYTKVTVHVNDEAAKRIADNDLTVDDAVKCISRVEWDGEEVLDKCLTAFALKVDEKAAELLKAVTDAIYNEPKLDRLLNLVVELFKKFSAQLLSIHRGSLVFVLQHPSVEMARKVLDDQSIQSEIQQMLRRFFPGSSDFDWVAESAAWSVSSYKTPSYQCQLRKHSESLCFSYVDQDDIITEKCMEYRIMKRVEKMFKPLLQDMQSMMANINRTVSQQQNFGQADHGTVSASSSNEEGNASEDVSGEDFDDESVRQSTNLGDKTMLVQESGGDGVALGVLVTSGSDLSSRGSTGKILQRDYHYESTSTEPLLSAAGGKLDSMNEPLASKQGFVELLTRQHREELKVYSTSLGPTTHSSEPVTHGHVMGNDSPRTPPILDTGPKPSSADPGFRLPTSFSDRVQERRDAAIAYPSTVKQRHQHTVYTAISTSKDITGMPGPDKREGSGSESGRSDPMTADTPSKKTKESKIQQAEHLLNWVNVKSKASQSTDPEIQRMMAQVEHALEAEDDSAPRAKALDTILVLDTSDSVVDTHLDQLKTVVHTFVDGIEEIVDTMNLEENLAVVQMGDRCWVRQHLTNDYARVRDVIDEMTADSSTMKTGGRTPIFQAMMVCLGAIEGRGGVVNVAGCHRVRPRIIFFTDGRPTDEATEKGSDQQTSVSEVKFALVQLISEFASKKHKTTPAPIFWVPVGKSPDRPFLESLAALSVGKVVEPERINELCRYYKVQETIGCVFKMVKKHSEDYQTEQQMKPIVDALAGNLDKEEKEYVIEEVRKKQKEPDSEPGEADDFDNVYEDKELVEAGKMPRLGTRVVRGPDWKWNNQDTEGPGTIIQHRTKRDNWLHVMWDNGTHNAYRYGDNGNYDVKITEDHPRRLSGSELIAIGVVVTRGDDWTDGDRDGNGTGVVIRKRKDGKVKVRWENGHVGKYKFGADGKFEVKIVDVPPAMHPPTQELHAGSAGGEELQGAVGGHDPAKGPTRPVWFWKDSQRDEWHMYNEETQEKLLESYRRRKDGTCIVSRDGKNWRVLFKAGQAKLVDKSFMHEVTCEEMTETAYRQRLETEFG